MTSYSLITKHKIKDYKTYIEDFHSSLAEHNKQRNENPDQIYNTTMKNKENEDIWDTFANNLFGSN